MANVNVTYQEMHDAAGKLTAGQTEIEDKLAQLKGLIESLVAGGYVTDSSSKSFQTAYDQFNTGAKNTISGLNDMSGYLKKAAQTFQDADTQLANALGR